ncbi:hypothetical protein EGW08_010035 [Elysia chlorotica]|uniref:CARD domain-containing protein n=1 Tax=Elysia chlorotica TaxID=188477 RepID=A0A3S1A3Z4_ELYCH|nr:hypothetical protein EGW08_010035 [Elysia chlorotica]
MEAEQREILIARRVELVEDIDIQGGLFTQLQSRKVLQRRTVNKIRLNRTPEEQVEELLNELPKRECFQDFCDALIADGQEHIVKKYLTAPLPASTKSKPSDSTPVAPPVAAGVESSRCASPASRSTESTDSSPIKRSHSATASTAALICIREEDNKHLYITYTDDGATPEKRKRALETGTASAVTFEPDETRYAMKHFVSQESGQPGLNGSVIPLTPHMVLNNPQSLLHNPNIEDPLRYTAAWKTSAGIPGSALLVSQTTDLGSSASSLSSGPVGIHSSPSDPQIKATAAPPASSSPSLSSPLKDPSSLVNKQDAESAHIRSLLRPQQGKPTVNIEQLKAARSGDSLDNGLIDIMSENVGGKFPGGLMASPGVESQLLGCSVGGAGDYDLDQIDLPDGCVNVKVEHCTRQFFLANHKKAYPMRQIPRGLALIINVDEVEGKPARKGTNFDRDNLCNLLCQLHFNIIVYNCASCISTSLSTMIRTVYLPRRW